MSENKSKSLRKLLLVCVASVLVAALSIGATAAYLTASTTPKENKFSASGDVKGKIMEPKFTASKTHYCEPGITEAKDPLVQNTTVGQTIYVGARLKFEICVNGNTYTQVDLDTFEQYVTVGWNTVDSLTGSSKSWKLISKNHNSDKFAYYLYDGLLSAYNTDAVTPTTDLTNAVAAAAAYESGGDNSRPIMISVTPKAGITIDANSSTTALPSSDYLSTTYKKFNYRITVDAYGVNSTSVTGANDLAKLTALSATSGDESMLLKLAALS